MRLDGSAPCPLCGSTTDDHTPTPDEAREHKRLVRRAFWHGFFFLPFEWAMNPPPRTRWTPWRRG